MAGKHEKTGPSSPGEDPDWEWIAMSEASKSTPDTARLSWLMMVRRGTMGGILVLVAHLAGLLPPLGYWLHW